MAVTRLGKIKAASAADPPAVGTADASLPDASLLARGVLFAMGGIAVALAIVANILHWNHAPFAPSKIPAADFGLFAGFYIGAQIIERVGELVAPLLPPWDFGGTPADKAAHAKADRAALMLGITFIAGVLLSFGSGLYLMQAVGFDVSNTVDVIVSGLVLAGGTTTLHNLITYTQSPSPPTTKST